MWLTSSSIGRKFVMALTGAFLVLFVTFHVLMNGVALFWPTAYNVVCEFLGANWYALVGTAVLAGGFLLHILYALWLTWENLRARGGDRYKVNSRPPQVEWSSKNMLVLGIVVLCFLAVHMYQFWAKMQLVEVLGLPSEVSPAAGTYFIQQAFSCPWTLVIYLIGFIALWFHMNHGFWSMWQTSGLNNKTWLPRLKCIAVVWSTFVVALFAIEAITFTVCAKKGVYENCPAIQAQVAEMNAQWNAEECNGCEAEALCPEAVCPEAGCQHECGAADCENCGDCDSECAGNCAECPSAGQCGDCLMEGGCQKAAACEHECEGMHADCPHHGGEQAPVENHVSKTLTNNI